ncbi:hypothetical protein [Cellvibrio sp. PSBB023]|nr:hypothetical protein [Cellvibrio sp. PSBB023]
MNRISTTFDMNEDGFATHVPLAVMTKWHVVAETDSWGYEG